MGLECTNSNGEIFLISKLNDTEHFFGNIAEIVFTNGSYKLFLQEDS